MSRLLLILLACRVGAAVPGTWLDLIGRIESANNPAAMGDSNRAAGEFQFHRCAWEHTSQLRAAKGKPVMPYAMATNREAGRAYASTWLEYLHDRLTTALGRAPTIGELYAAHNLGYAGFKARGFDLKACPSVTRRKASMLDKAVCH